MSLVGTAPDETALEAGGHLAYLGPPTALSDLLFDAPHALARQAECPRRQTSGTTNPDGWGVGWYTEGAAELTGRVVHGWSFHSIGRAPALPRPVAGMTAV